MTDVISRIQQRLEEGSAPAAAGGDVIARIRERTQGGMAPVAAPQGVDDRGEFVKGVSRNVTQLKGMGAGLVSAGAGLVGAEETEREWADTYRGIMEEIKDDPAAVGRVEDIQNVGDFFDWAAGALGENVLTLGTIVASGGVGGLIAKKVAERAISKKLGDALGSEVGKKLLQEGGRQAAAKGAKVGAFTGAAGIETGATYGEQIEAGVERSPAVAFAAGGIKGALELVPLVNVAKGLGLGEVAEEGVIAAIKSMPALKRIAAMGALTGASEAGTEALQEAVDIAARRIVDERYDVLGEEAKSRVLNAAAAGGLVGGVYGGIGGGFAKRTEAGLELEDKELPPETKPGEPGEIAGIKVEEPEVEEIEITAVPETVEEIEKESDTTLHPLNAEVQNLQNKGILPANSLLATVDGRLDPTWDLFSGRKLRGEARAGQIPSTLERTTKDIAPGEVAWVSDTIGENLYTETKTSKIITKTLGSWIQRFAPDMRIALVSKDIVEAQTGSSSLGSAWSDSDGVQYITIAPRLMRNIKLNEKFYGTLAHEFGHTLIDHVFRSASQEVKTKLYNAYRKYLNAAVADPKIWAENFASAEDPLMHLVKDDPIGTVSALNTLTGGRRGAVAYYLSFEEWAAQQVNKHMQSNVEAQGGVALFFKAVARKLRQFYNTATSNFKLNETFEEFMQALSSRQLNEWVQETSVNIEANRKVDRNLDGLVKQMIDREVEAPKDGYPTPAKFNQFMRWMENLLQIAKQNAHIPGVSRYVELTRQWWKDKTAITDMANTRLGEWNLSKDDQGRFHNFLYAATLKSDQLQRKLDDLEKAELLEEHGLAGNQEVELLYERIQEDFHKAIRDLFQVLRNDARRRFAGQATELEEALGKLEIEEGALLNRDFFPLSRFGRYWVHFRTSKPTNIGGEHFTGGETVTFEMYETRKQAEQRAAQLRRVYPQHAKTIGSSQVSDVTETMGWMPPSMIESLIGKLALTEEQQAELRLLMHERAPGQSYKKHLLHRKGVKGFSTDAKRTYAAYFMHFANHFSRIKHFSAMHDAMQEIGKYARRVEAGQEGTDTRRLADYFQRHYDYAMNPGNELANLRSAGFLWYLGFLPKSALVNLTQVPLVTYPYLAAKYGDVGAVAELSRAMKDMRKVWGNRRGEELEGDLQWGIGEGIKAGFLNESLATELANVAEGSNLSRLLPGTFLRSEKGAAHVRRMAHWGAYLFQTAEKLNRFQTFTAAWRLEQKKNPTASKQQLFEAARDAVDTTQYEYARWNRPEFMRGKKSVFFMFYQYLQNTLYFARYEPGRARFFMALLFIAGLQGLPGAEDLMDLWDYTATRMKGLLGWKNPKTDVRLYLREMIGDLGGDPDLWMHGTSRVGFGASFLGELMGLPIPQVDLSGSLSLGRVMPGVEPILGREGDFKTRVLGTATDVGGAATSAGMGILQAIADDNPDTLKRVERALPTVVKSVVRAARWARDEGETTYSGAKLVSMDPTDPLDFATIVGQGLGFRPTEVAREQELLWAQKEHAAYYQHRRELILRQMDFAFQTGDREAIADVRKAVRLFNSGVPHPALRILGKDIAKSRKLREKGRMKEERGLPRSKKDVGLYRQVEGRFEG